MNDIIAEKLTQKVINLIEEVNDVNLVVRGIAPPQETVNRIHERIEAMYTAIKQIEKKLNLDEERLNKLEEQTKALQEALDLLKKAMNEAVDKMERNNDRYLIRLSQDITHVGSSIGKRFEDMEKNFKSVFWGQAFWLIVLALVVVAGFIIIM